jgi:pantothenate kinase
LTLQLRFLSDIKAGRRTVRAPVYSHLVYDVMPNRSIEIDRPEIFIVEGLNVLQTGRLPRDDKAIPCVSDFFDFSVYLDANEARTGMSTASLRSGKPLSATRNPFSAAMRASPMRRQSRPPPRSGRGSISSTL